MHLQKLHSWVVDYKQAVEIQNRLSNRIKEISLSKEPELVAGVDVSYDSKTERMYGAVIVFKWPELIVVEKVITTRLLRFPYIPGLLTFREGPVLTAAFKKVRSNIDLVFFDGQGIAHPRRLGIASHMGLWVGRASIGCAKSRLIGNYREPGEKRGSYSRLVYKEKTVGAVLRTRSGVKPVYVSIGHKITLKQAVGFVLTATPRYRVPEPIRQAHILCNSLRCGN